jgi:hypothetical protein
MPLGLVGFLGRTISNAPHPLQIRISSPSGRPTLVVACDGFARHVGRCFMGSPRRWAIGLIAIGLAVERRGSSGDDVWDAFTKVPTSH